MAEVTEDLDSERARSLCEDYTPDVEKSGPSFAPSKFLREAAVGGWRRRRDHVAHQGYPPWVIATLS